MASSQQTIRRTIDCDCTTCLSLRQARKHIHAAVSNISFAGGERAAVEKIAAATNLLSDAQLLLHRVHQPQMYDHTTGDLRADPGPPVQTSPTRVLDGAPPQVMKASPAEADGASSTHNRQVTNPWAASDGNGSPTKTSRPNTSKAFDETLRARAAELGILRDSADLSAQGTSPPKFTNFVDPLTFRDTSSSAKDKSQFIVCDHCRSHGIRCNEASVCKECILREVPCTHRQCDLSPNSRAECPRQVCFYVHGDWMPDIYGGHNPKDPNWLILPGKLRERLSAGQLSKISHKDDAETTRCYQSVAARQATAVKEMGKCVQAGMGTWETVAMKCACVEIEREEQRTRSAEENMRRLALSSTSSE
ncbi:Hypothetical predicted protein [Lecanosticta acicola]|uniref:Zn(2)-C6 fungal-type domain-containing protein n=1 Tax=Lecanosticta acicola TaxID=111012 RepID=A0AAI8Z1R4_9PEZI|nr:Hypothetical predicted protein [Lecanosticta acicola]